MPESVREAAERLRANTLATRVTVEKWGVYKGLTRDQKRRAALPFNADTASLTTRKRIVNLRHPAVRRLTSLCSAVRNFWISCTLPYIEEGVRLVNREQLSALEVGLASYTNELITASQELDAAMPEVRDEARQMLADLYNPNDYPEEPGALYRINYRRVSVEPPGYLKTIDPSAYEEEMAAFRARMEASVQQAEQAFTDELALLVSHLADRLTPNPDGTTKVLRASAIDNLNDFFVKFRSLNVRDNTELEAVLTQAASLVNGRDAATLRESPTWRDEVREGMAEVFAKLEPHVSNKARRKLKIDVSQVQLVGS